MVVCLFMGRTVRQTIVLIDPEGVGKNIYRDIPESKLDQISAQALESVKCQMAQDVSP